MALKAWTAIVAVAVAMTTMAEIGDAFTPMVIKEVVERGRIKSPSSGPGNVSKECMLAITEASANPAVAIPVLDAFGKPEAGFLAGNLHWLGHYDECQNITNFQYCAAFLDADIQPVFQLPKPTFVPLTWGMCMPENCSEADVQNLLNIYLLNITKIVFPVNNESAVVCAYKDHAPFDGGFIATVIVFGAIFVLMLLGAGYDTYLRYRDTKADNLVVYTNASANDNMNGGNPSARRDNAAPETNDDDVRLILLPEPPRLALWERFLLCFAFNRNLVKILSTKQNKRNVNCLNGLRVISMSWVILGHAFFFPMEMGVTGNILFAVGWYQLFAFQAIANAVFSVDSFFFLSGFLLAFITLRKMKQKEGNFPWGLFYFHRYWRLTPAVIATMLIWMYLKPYVGDGPLWQTFQNIDSCIDYWWTNILYINNFYPTKFGGQCIGWVWYLANDMQFFIISPLLLLPLYYIPWLGVSLTGLLMLSSFVVTGVIAGIYQFGPTGGQIVGLEPQTHDWQSMVYEKPYCRITPYLVGMLLGYFMHRQGERRVKLSPGIVAFGWAAASAVGMSVVYGLYQSQPTLAASVTYNILSRFAWAVALSWVVFACKEGYGGWVDDMLSWNAWLPLSRVTYSAYLLHPIVIYIFLGNLKNSMMASLWLQPVYFVAYLTLAYAAAVVMSLFIDYPFANLEGLMFKSTI